MLVFVRRLLSLFLGSVALASFLAALALCCLPPTASADDGRNGPLIVSNCFFDCWCDPFASWPNCSFFLCNQPGECTQVCNCAQRGGTWTTCVCRAK
jgi:hypothetical protein